MEFSQPVFDHVALWAPALATDTEAFGARLGVAVHPGGAHPGEGTRNALVGAPRQTYVELLSTDPDQPMGGGLARRFALAEQYAPCLAAFSTNALEAVAARAAAAGLTCDGPKRMERQTPNGVLAWRLLFLASERWPCLPFFIDWGSAPHPSARLPGGLTALGVSFCDPEPAATRALFEALKLDCPVVGAPAPGLEARMLGPRGEAGWRSAVSTDGVWRSVVINH
jgi:Glyoxalase-like domain